MAKNSNNGFILLKRYWLIIIIIAAIGSPFATFATYRERVNTIGKTVEKQQNVIDEHSKAIAEIGPMLNLILGELKDLKKNK